MVKRLMPSMQARKLWSCWIKRQLYAESGGQVGDKGELKGANFSFAVEDTQKYGQAIGHIGKLAAGSLKVGDAVQADVDEARRARIRLRSLRNAPDARCAAPGSGYSCISRKVHWLTTKCCASTSHTTKR
ncbi:alanine--tRNA ligase-related protein [Escherichia coli]